MTPAAKKFASYLAGTLAPDLYQSGREYTASDVKDLAHLIREPDSHMVDGRNGPAFIAYLKGTLIPDLRASGSHDTASDIAEGVRHWERAHKKLERELTRPVYVCPSCPRKFKSAGAFAIHQKHKHSRIA